MHLSVIISAYNEEERLPKTIYAVDNYLRNQTFQYEIIIVNDGSRDKTIDIIKDLSIKIPNLRFIDIKINQGKGNGVCMGMLSATGEYRLFMDADNSTSLNQIEKMLPWVREGYSVIVSSRRIKGSEIKVEQPKYRLFLGWLFRIYVQIMLSLGIKDTQNGFKLFTSKAAEDIFSRQTIFRWGFDVEVLVIARKLGYKIKEVPIEWVNNNQSRVTFMGTLYMAFEIVKIKWNLMTNKYRI